MVLMFLFPYARDEGKACGFIKGMNSKIFWRATIIGLLCAVIVWQLKGALSFGLAMLFAFLVGKFVVKKIGGITGDTLGAISELEEVSVLCAIFILNRVFA